MKTSIENGRTVYVIGEEVADYVCFVAIVLVLAVVIMGVMLGFLAV